MNPIEILQVDAVAKRAALLAQLFEALDHARGPAPQSGTLDLAIISSMLACASLRLVRAVQQEAPDLLDEPQKEPYMRQLRQWLEQLESSAPRLISEEDDDYDYELYLELQSHLLSLMREVLGPEHLPDAARWTA